MDYNPDAAMEWRGALLQFAGYREEAVEILRRLGERATLEMHAGHPPGGPHPGPGETPQYHEHAYIDRTGWLTESVGFHIEQVFPWDPSTGAAPRLPTLLVYATAPYAEAVEHGVPGHSRAYPFFWPSIYHESDIAEHELGALIEQTNARDYTRGGQ